MTVAVMTCRRKRRGQRLFSQGRQRRYVSGVELSPGVDNKQNLWYIKIGKRDIVRGREDNDIAFPRDGFSLQE